ncbi:hypothetical protein GF359_04905, partial [candidate division WOR-3 bacterium]|nr:hypothetical protein [candidate division WOR-3 bacterium]MBD3364534.1 hypothetical protein [candidate division WOR-3 bacterium]
MVAICFRLAACLFALVAGESRIREVVFEDNRAFSDFTLAREIELSSGEIYSEAQATADARAIEIFYQSSGFEKPRVKTVYHWLWPRKLIFKIREGRGPTVRRLRLKGKLGFSASRLKGIIGTEINRLYEARKVSEDSNHLVSFFRNQGYPHAEIATDYDTSKRRLTFYIQKGKRLKIENIVFSGVAPDDTTAIKRLIPLKKNKPVTVLGLQETLMATARYFRNRGYYYVDVRLTRSRKGYDVELLIEV